MTFVGAPNQEQIAQAAETARQAVAQFAATGQAAPSGTTNEVRPTKEQRYQQLLQSGISPEAALDKLIDEGY
jgi:hypothetical protein